MQLTRCYYCRTMKIVLHRASRKKATDAAHSLLLLQDDEDSASSGIPEEGD